MKSIRFSAEANSDLAEISGYIFNLDSVAAHKFLNRIDETCEILAEHPRLGRLRPEFGENLRSFPVGNYLLFYSPASDGINVSRVLYGGRDLPKIFED